MFAIRPFDFSDADYAAIVAVWTSAHPNEPGSVHVRRRLDKSLLSDPDRVLYRVLAVLDETTAEPGRCIGYGHFMHKPWSYHPRKLALYLTVHPDYEQADVDNAIYEHLWQQVQGYDPISLESLAFEDQPSAMMFLQRRGFRVVQRESSSQLDTAHFDSQAHTGLLGRVAASGIRICTLSDMMAEEPDYLRRLHSLESELVTEVPYYDARVEPTPYESWVKAYSDNPDLLPEANLVAVDGDRLVGMTNLWASRSTDRILYTGFTGVLPTYRRRGIATALKVRALTYARGLLTSTGEHPLVRTGNEENNPMLQINLCLGFVELPGEVILLKELG